MKPKALDGNQPWIPNSYVVDKQPISIDKFEDDSRRKYCAVKVRQAIMKAQRCEDSGHED